MAALTPHGDLLQILAIAVINQQVYVLGLGVQGLGVQVLGLGVQVILNHLSSWAPSLILKGKVCSRTSSNSEKLWKECSRCSVGRGNRNRFY